VNPEHKALVREFRREVADELTERLRADELADRARMSPADQRQFGRQLINRRLERHARQQLEQGREPLTFEDETALAQAIHDACSDSARCNGCSTTSPSRTSTPTAAPTCG
jgi:hypothetical protein